MATELETFARHARAMSKATHRPDCANPTSRRRWRRRVGNVDGGYVASCPGCVTDEDRVRWAALADEAETQVRRVVLA